MTNTALEFHTLPGPLREYATTTGLFGFKAESPGETWGWQLRLRCALAALPGGFPDLACNLSPQILEEHNDHIDTAIFEGKHTWNGVKGKDWQDRWLSIKMSCRASFHLPSYKMIKNN